MDDEELGLDTLIQKDGKRTSVTIADATIKVQMAG